MHICKLDVFFLRKAFVSSSVDFAETSLLLLFRMVFCWSSVSYNICEQMLVKNTKVRKTILVWKALIRLPMLYQRKYLASSFYIITYSYAVNPVKECHCWLFNLLRSVMQNSSELTLATDVWTCSHWPKTTKSWSPEHSRMFPIECHFVTT